MRWYDHARVYGIYDRQANMLLYVGSSTYYPERVINHLNKLRRGQHYNKQLQAAYNSLGESGITFVVLEKPEVPPDIVGQAAIAPVWRRWRKLVHQREQAAIDALRPLFNVTPASFSG